MIHENELDKNNPLPFHSHPFEKEKLPWRLECWICEQLSMLMPADYAAEPWSDSAVLFNSAAILSRRLFF